MMSSLILPGGDWYVYAWSPGLVNFLQMMSFAFWWMLAFGLVYLIFLGAIILVKLSFSS
jgi:hypothetical protein